MDSSNNRRERTSMASEAWVLGPHPKRQMKVLALGLPRTGSASVAEALSLLGYRNVCHGIRFLSDSQAWGVLNRAADATFPSLPTYTGTPFTRAQWDEFYGASEAATDVAAAFAPELIKTYPEAKVVLVVRDFVSWRRSVDQSIFAALSGPLAWSLINVVEPLAKSVTTGTVRKIALGHFGARTMSEARENARDTYDRHHRLIQDMVPVEQLLVYKLSDGWGPLCDFLDKPVPEVDFPWANDAESLKSALVEKMKRDLAAAAMAVFPWVAASVVLGVAGWKMAK